MIKFSVSLAALGENLISRAQAKSVTAQFDGFNEVELDFHGVEDIGQAFADQLLRVWPLSHLQTKLVIVNANRSVEQIISHIRGRKDLPQPYGW